MGRLQVMLLLLPLLFLGIMQLVTSLNHPSSSNTNCIDTEREALLMFRHSLIDKSERLSSWHGQNCCKWKGVGCSNSTGHVTSLDLRNQLFFDTYRYYNDKIYAESYRNSCLGGQLDQSLIKLEQLQYLDLGMNNFLGMSIPPFLGSLRNMRYIDLSNAGFGGYIPFELGNLSMLSHLYLGDASEGWTIGSDYTLKARSLWWTTKLVSLESLDLSNVVVEETRGWLDIVNKLPHLRSLSLAGCSLNTIPLVSQVNFTSLETLELQGNGFMSPFPLWLFNLKSLKTLHLEGNYFNGPIPDTISQLSSLTFLDVSSNRLNDSLPNSLCNLTSLAHLSLSFNRFQGVLPTCLGKMVSLTRLSVEANSLTGGIPTSMGQLSKLEQLILANNPLSGALTETHFLELTELRDFRISSTMLTWNVSTDWIPPFQLQYVYMDSSKVGPKFPQWLRYQKEVVTLVMSNASISDTIPEWFEVVQSKVNYLDLNRNHIGGKLPKLEYANGFYRSIIMAGNNFDGPLTYPSDALAIDISRNHLTGSLPTLEANQTMPFLRYLNINDNLLSGTIPEYLCNITTLLMLDLSNNQLSGQIPLCLGNLRRLSLLNLGNNSLHGKIPSSLGNMEVLLYLHLNNNELSGELPLSMGNLTNLEVFDLGENQVNGSLPTWFGENFMYLRILRLQSNQFSGNITMELCSLVNLQLLSLANNKLQGEIPRCLHELRAMASTDPNLIPFSFYNARHPQTLSSFMKGRELEYSSNLPFVRSLELSGNNIVGHIPEELMDLVGLQSLNLSKNHLIGEIPERIGNLKQLESLDLSRNQLSGSIPTSIAGINSLSFLNLSFNQLLGRIPEGTQLQTMDDQSYLGNRGLCGKPLLTICSDDKHVSHKIDQENDQDSDSIWFYSGLAPGFAAGNLVIFGILLYNKAWRLTYFQFIDKVCNLRA